MTTLETKMYERAEQQYRDAELMGAGSEECVKTTNLANGTVDRLNELRKIRLEEKKLEYEKARLEAEKAREEKKLEFEKARLEADKRDRFIKNVMTGVTFGVGALITIWANIDSKKFEGAFTHTTSAGRQSESKLLSFMDRVKV
jgi:hypothetical protein